MISDVFKKYLLGRWFAVEEEGIKLFGKMDWTLLHSRIFAMTIQEIGKTKGKDYLFNLGYDQGKDVALEMIKHMGLKMKAGWVTQKAVIDVLDFIGFGRPKIILSKVEKDGHHHIVSHIEDNPAVENALKLYGNKSLVCHWFMGVFSAHVEYEWGAKNCRFKEIKCMCKGSPYCEWESKG